MATTARARLYGRLLSSPSSKRRQLPWHLRVAQGVRGAGSRNYISALKTGSDDLYQGKHI
jgi:hypothetical protein